MLKKMVLCTGNSCRSQRVEYISKYFGRRILESCRTEPEIKRILFPLTTRLVSKDGGADTQRIQKCA